MKSHSILLLSLFLSVPALATDFKIKKGDHHSSPLIERIYHGTKFNFEAEFDESAKYNFEGESASDQADTNKLFGFSDCGDLHTENSARIGWRWYNGQLEAMAFTHKNGHFSFEPLGVMDFKKPYKFSIDISPDKTKYIYRFGNNTVEMDRGCTDSQATGYLLKPYFGGNQVAPHDIKIKIGYEGNEDKYANFSVNAPYPNPTNKNNVNVDMCVQEDMSVSFKVFDMLGRLVKISDPKYFSGGQTYKEEKVDLGEVSSGVYLVVPYGERNGVEKPGMVTTKGDALKVIISK